MREYFLLCPLFDGRWPPPARRLFRNVRRREEKRGDRKRKTEGGGGGGGGSSSGGGGGRDHASTQVAVAAVGRSVSCIVVNRILKFRLLALQLFRQKGTVLTKMLSIVQVINFV